MTKINQKSKFRLRADCKSKYSPETSLTSRQNSKMGSKSANSQKNVSQKSKLRLKINPNFPIYYDQIRAQNTSQDWITAHKSKQQPKSSLKARYESKTRFKITKLIKKLKNLIKIPKICQKSIKIPV